MAIYGKYVSEEYLSEGVFFASKEGKEIKNKVKAICKENRSGIGDGLKRTFSKSGAYDDEKRKTNIKKIEKLFDTFSCSMTIIETVDDATTYYNNIVAIKGNLICEFKLYSDQRGQSVGYWGDRYCDKVKMDKELVKKIITTCDGNLYSISKQKVSLAQFSTQNTRQILNSIYNELKSFVDKKYPDIEVKLNDNLLQNSISFKRK